MTHSRFCSIQSEINLAEAAQSPEIGALWGQLGMLYQAHDIRYHDGGTLQPLALEAFRKAISLSDDNTVLYQVHQRLGMLLKMMSRGEEAVVEHTIAYELAVSAEEKADALQQHAAALGMIGDLKGSIELLEKSLRIYPKGLAAYLPLVAAQKELKQWSPREWSRIVEDMTAAIKSASDSKYKHNKIKVPGEIYWAMFQALELLGRFEDAWGYLDIAHKVSLESREKVSSLRQMDDQLQQVVTVFQKSMFPEPPLGSASKTPVFIVGMMRYSIVNCIMSQILSHSPFQ